MADHQGLVDIKTPLTIINRYERNSLIFTLIAAGTPILLMISTALIALWGIDTPTGRLLVVTLLPVCTLGLLVFRTIRYPPQITLGANRSDILFHSGTKTRSRRIQEQGQIEIRRFTWYSREQRVRRSKLQLVVSMPAETLTLVEYRDTKSGRERAERDAHNVSAILELPLHIRAYPNAFRSD